MSIITALMMVVEIVAGLWFNSMALEADGWHMSSHAVAIGLSAFAYAVSRRYAHDRRFAFGTWKIEVLASFVSALFLIAVAVGMVWGSIERLISPQPIHFEEAILVAVLGLIVNLVCARILHHGPGHDHHHHHHHGHDNHGHVARDHHHDLNLKAAYLHVLADAATSVLAIAALVAGMVWGWTWLDPVMGILGAALVAAWARGLLVESGSVLLDCEVDPGLTKALGNTITSHPVWGASVELADLHVWRVGRNHYAAIISLISHGDALNPDQVKVALAVHQELVHLSVEINNCELER